MMPWRIRHLKYFPECLLGNQCDPVKKEYIRDKDHD